MLRSCENLMSELSLRECNYFFTQLYRTSLRRYQSILTLLKYLAFDNQSLIYLLKTSISYKKLEQQVGRLLYEISLTWPWDLDVNKSRKVDFYTPVIELYLFLTWWVQGIPWSSILGFNHWLKTIYVHFTSVLVDQWSQPWSHIYSNRNDWA